MAAFGGAPVKKCNFNIKKLLEAKFIDRKTKNFISASIKEQIAK